MIRGAVTECSATTYAAGIAVSAGANASLIDVLVASRQSKEGDGGCMFVEDATLTMNGGAIRDCEASNGWGGGLHRNDALKAWGLGDELCNNYRDFLMPDFYTAFCAEHGFLDVQSAVLAAIE